ncbi:hypothetical protein BB561_006870, partial [Smittium simulii]
MFNKAVYLAGILGLMLLGQVYSQCSNQLEFENCLRTNNIQKGTECLGLTDFNCLCSYSKKILKCYDICSQDLKKQEDRNGAVSQVNNDCGNENKFGAVVSIYSSLVVAESATGSASATNAEKTTSVEGDEIARTADVDSNGKKNSGQRLALSGQ